MRQPPPPPPLAQPPGPPVWQRWLQAAATWCYRAVCRPRVRLVVIGLVLLALGALVVTNSVWTLPLLIVGGLMLVIAWVGSRLEGRFLVEWGEGSTGLELKARIKSAEPQQLAAPAPEPAPAAQEEPVLESTAETIEIDLDELKALVAEADRKAASQRDLAKAGSAKGAS